MKFGRNNLYDCRTAYPKIRAAEQAVPSTIMLVQRVQQEGQKLKWIPWRLAKSCGSHHVMYSVNKDFAYCNKIADLALN